MLAESASRDNNVGSVCDPLLPWIETFAFLPLQVTKTLLESRPPVAGYDQNPPCNGLLMGYGLHVLRGCHQLAPALLLPWPSQWPQRFVGSCADFPTYYLRFKTKVTFGHKLRYEIKVTFGEISLKLRQTKCNVAKNNVFVVAIELPSYVK
jgi:hypothetical protein